MFTQFKHVVQCHGQMVPGAGNLTNPRRSLLCTSLIERSRGIMNTYPQYLEEYDDAGPRDSLSRIPLHFQENSLPVNLL